MPGPIDDYFVHGKLLVADTADTPPIPIAPTQSFPAPLSKISNLCSAIADNPTVLPNYHRLTQLILDSSFTSTERCVLWLTVCIEHQDPGLTCTDIMQAQHDSFQSDIIETLWNGWALPNRRLESLHRFAQTLLHQGYLAPADVSDLFQVGFTQHQALEIVLMWSHVVNVSIPLTRGTVRF